MSNGCKKSIAIGIIMLMAVGLAGCGTKNGGAGNGQDVVDNFPTDTIRIIVHQDAGGAIDFTTRVMAEYAQKKLGVPVVVENVLGASGRIAHTQVFNAKPDGYLLGTANIPTLPMGELAFDGQYKSNEYKFIYGYVDTGHVLAVKDDSPIKDLDDLVQRLEAGRVTISTFGNGSSSHLQMAAFVDSLGVMDNAAFVHFEGTTPQLAAQLGGNTDVAITGYGGFSRTEGLRALAVFADERDEFLDAPTIGEYGYENAPIISQIWGIVAPPDTPTKIVNILADAFAEAAQDPQTTERFNTIRLSVAQMTPEVFGENAIMQYDLVKKYLDLMTE